MFSGENFCITGLSTSEHIFEKYHFCRGNNSKRKNRIGLIEAGNAEFMYLNKKMPVKQNDIIFIPEKIFCYSEWVGNPEIRVTYLNFNIESDNYIDSFELQKLGEADNKTIEIFNQIKQNLNGDLKEWLSAYSLFYTVLSEHLPNMKSRKKLNIDLCRATDYITTHYTEDISVKDIAKANGMSESKLYHLFQSQLGQTPITYLNALKVNLAIQHLEKGEYSVAEICRIVNFHSETYFRRVFKGITGMNPLEYKKHFNRI